MLKMLKSTETTSKTFTFSLILTRKNFSTYKNPDVRRHLFLILTGVGRHACKKIYALESKNTSSTVTLKDLLTSKAIFLYGRKKGKLKLNDWSSRKASLILKPCNYEL